MADLNLADAYKGVLVQRNCQYLVLIFLRIWALNKNQIPSILFSYLLYNYALSYTYMLNRNRNSVILINNICKIS